jgi:hypothetical protein
VRRTQIGFGAPAEETTAVPYQSGKTVPLTARAPERGAEFMVNEAFSLEYEVCLMYVKLSIDC